MRVAPRGMTHPFLAASTWDAAREPGHFTGRVDERWLQGRGAFGGLINGGIVRAMQAVVADPRRRLRTFHVHFCAPARPGPFQCVVVVERAGAGVTTLSARVLQEGGVVSVATATFAFARNNPDAALVFSEAPPPSSLPPLEETPPTPRDPSVLPAFTQFFEYRFCLGALPFSQADRALIGGYLAFAEPLPIVDHAAVVALIDAYPPALLPKLSSLRGSSSVDMSVDLHVDAPVAGTHFIVRQSARVGDGGFTDERGELWTLDGALVATSRQLVTVL
jgi:acyl-CoA thioesterase